MGRNYRKGSARRNALVGAMRVVGKIGTLPYAELKQVKEANARRMEDKEAVKRAELRSQMSQRNKTTRASVTLPRVSFTDD